MKYFFLDIYDDVRHWLLYRFSKQYRDGVDRFLKDIGF